MSKRPLFVAAILAAALIMPSITFAQTTQTPTKPAAAVKAKAKTAKPAAKAAEKTAPASAAASAPKVLIKTSMGDITIELYPDKAPKSVENFLEYVKSGFYDGTVFHRVIGSFMIQGGGFTKDLHQKKTRASIPIESKNGLGNTRGSVAMARTGDPNSATAQFFINVADNPRLDYTSDVSPGYAVFGKVVSGLDIVDKIKAVPTGPQGPFRSDVPTTPVVIEKVALAP